MISFSPPRMDKKIVDAVVDTLYSGWITTGPKTKKFEKMLTAYGGQQATLCVSSGSAGLEFALRWFGVGEGDEVIVPAYTYCATANVVPHCGAKVIFVDVGEDFNISVEAIEKAITPRTKAIIPVDIAGFPCDYNEINALVNREDIRKKFMPETNEQKELGRILVLSDAAHSIGAWYHGKRTGSLTDITVYSFHAVKTITTAEGGAICLNLPSPFDNEAIYQDLNIKSLHGQTKDALTKTQIGNWRYDIVELGYKFNMTDIQAAMGMVELERNDNDMLVRRKEVFDRYTTALSAYPWAQLPTYETPEKQSSYHVFLLRINGINEEQRDEIIREIFKRDVAVNVHFVPLPMMTYYKDAGYRMPDYPISYDNYSREITLPVYYDLTDEMVDEVVRAVVEAVEEVVNL
ncbi:MAG: DegT/DnrJ/EryC1/StrS family aminotransferase [Bacteroidales bacterium]|nr:DegT/DnrJ/EryC1/StrS family aminotransferase [Bacteroidota bacterium]MBL6949621.1 DegT/DnrJ/EryC1/StrS family aminotransferase [Bacteroidales bacterium]